MGGEPQQRPFEGFLGSQRPLLQVPGWASWPAGTVRGSEPALPRVYSKPLPAGSRWALRTCRRREPALEFPELPPGVGRSVFVTRASPASVIR